MTVPFNKSNNRIFWACQAVFVLERNTMEEVATEDSTFLTGVQSIGVSSSRSANSLIDIGKVQKKYTQYNQNTYEVTIERRIDKNSKFFYNTDSTYSNYLSSHILHVNNLGSQGFKDSSDQCLRNYDITILYRPDRFSNFTSVSTDPEEQDNTDVISVTYKYCLITNISYSMSVENGITESITLTTNNMKYNNDISNTGSYNIPSMPQDGDIIKEYDLDFTMPGYGFSLLPKEVEQLFTLNTIFDTKKDGSPLVDKRILSIQSIDISIGINYSTLTDIGIWRGSENGKEYEQNKWKYINLPIDVSCSFRGIARQSMPFFNFLSGGLNKVANVDHIYTKALGNGATGMSWQEADRKIRIVAVKKISGVDNYFVWDLGSSNYLTELSYSGGDTGGGNVEATISYRNDFSDAVFTKTTGVINLGQTQF